MNRIEVNPGDRFGRLVVVSALGGHPRKLECVCDCGNKVTADLNRIRCNKTKSCGCLRREMTISKNTTHGMSAKTEYGIWCGIGKRILNPKCKSWKDYGGRGITICERWNDFSLFLKDVGHRPHPSMTIERISVNGNYEPSNVKWATRKEQNRNSRNNKFITIGKESHCVAEWDEIFAKRYALKPGRFKSRYYRYGIKSWLKWIKGLAVQIPLIDLKAAEVTQENLFAAVNEVTEYTERLTGAAPEGKSQLKPLMCPTLDEAV